MPLDEEPSVISLCILPSSYKEKQNELQLVPEILFRVFQIVWRSIKIKISMKNGKEAMTTAKNEDFMRL